MNLVKIKEIHNHTLYVNQDTLEFIIKKTYELDAVSILTSIKSMKDTLNVPQIYSLEDTDNKVVSYEQYIEGETLASFIEEGKFVTHINFIDYTLQLLKTLMCLHEINIVHKDIKPDNLIISGEQIYLIDFDISRIYDERKTKDTRLLGTEGYASPEQYGFGQTTPKSDIFSLGKTLEDLLAITIVEPQYYDFYQNIIVQMTEYDPNNRCTLSKIQAIFLESKQHYANNNQTNGAPKNLQNITKVNKIRKFIPIVYTTTGLTTDMISTTLLSAFCFSFVSDAPAYASEYAISAYIIAILITILIFNQYMIALSVPRFRKKRNEKKENPTTTIRQWLGFGIVDFFVFAVIFQMLFDMFLKVLAA